MNAKTNANTKIPTKYFNFVLACTAISFLSSCGPKIPVFGLDDNGNLVEQNIPVQEYSKQLTEVLSNVQNSTLPVLQQTQNQTQEGWALRTAVIGLGVSGEAGIGPITFGASSRIRLAFTNSSDPAVP